jgi:hypothetical protein
MSWYMFRLSSPAVSHVSASKSCLYVLYRDLHKSGSNRLLTNFLHEVISDADLGYANRLRIPFTRTRTDLAQVGADVFCLRLPAAFLVALRFSLTKRSRGYLRCRSELCQSTTHSIHTYTHRFSSSWRRCVLSPTPAAFLSSPLTTPVSCKLFRHNTGCHKVSQNHPRCLASNFEITLGLPMVGSRCWPSPLRHCHFSASFFSSFLASSNSLALPGFS